MQFARNTITLIAFIFASVFHSYGQIAIQRDSSGNLKIDTAKYNTMARFSFPAPLGYVSDFDHILDSSTISILNKLIIEHRDKTTDQLAVVTISDYAPYDNLGVYSQALSNTWGVGTKEKDNGVVIVVCNPKREIRISTGTGIANRLNDVACEEITDYFIIPQFKKGNYSQGLIDAVKEIIRQLQK